MSPGGVRLSIDYGAATTKAVLAWPDGRYQQLSLDAGGVVSNAVFVRPDGGVVTGGVAWQAAAEQPQRLVLSPLRAGGDQVQVDGVDVPVADLVAASLRRVADEAVQVVGQRVTDVRLVVPAGWGPRRRTWMRQVAYRAGLGQPTLVEAPVAVAEHLLALGVQWPVGSFLLVCDLGAGAEVSVLRRGPAGFEVLSTLDDPAAGGFTVDDALLAALPVAAGGGAGHGPVPGPAVRAAVLAGKEALSQHAAVTVPMPDAPAMVLTGLTVEQAARPVVAAAAELAAAAVAAAKINAGDLAGVYCVGAGARLPLVERVLAERLRLVPRVVVDPGVAAVRGAAGAVTAAAGGPGPADEAPELPPVRRAVAVSLPGFASLALIAFTVFTAQREHVGWPQYYVRLDWGGFVMACVFAVVACLASGTMLASLVATGGRDAVRASPGMRVGMGILAAAFLGVAFAGMYAMVSAMYFTWGTERFLRWALLPITPIVVVAVVIALVAAWQWRTPRQGWAELLAFPTSSVVLGAGGMLLLRQAMITPYYTWTQWRVELLARIAGLLLGLGMVAAVVRPLVPRLVIAVPVAVTTAVVSWNATEFLGVAYAIAVALWGLQRLWTLIFQSATPLRAPS